MSDVQEVSKSANPFNNWFAVHLITIVMVVGGGLIQFGSLETRLASVERTSATNSEAYERLGTRLVAANEHTAQGLADLAGELRYIRGTMAGNISKNSALIRANSASIRSNAANIYRETAVRQDELNNHTSTSLKSLIRPNISSIQR